MSARDDRVLRLIDMMRFTESISAKLQGVSDEAEVYRVIGEEFGRSKRYSATILLLTEGGTKLRLLTSSFDSGRFEAGEKTVGVKREGYEIDLARSTILSRVAKGGETLSVRPSDVVQELFPSPMASLISKVMDLERRNTIVTPVSKHGKTAAVLAMSSAELADLFIPSVRYLAQHIAVALERCGDNAERLRLRKELESYAQHLEHLVEERTRELRKAERLATVGEIAAAVGHDLSGPLQAMMNEIYVTKTKIGELSPDRRRTLEDSGLLRFLKRAESEVWYMTTIVSDLKDLTRPMELKPVEVSVRDVLDGVISGTEVPTNVKVSVRTGDEQNTPKVLVDIGSMKRVFMNLVNNAVQAMPEGGELQIRVSRDVEMAITSFRDTGIGIRDEHKRRLFEPLFTTKPGGIGLGLVICRRLVEANGGRIEVESEAGKGTTVVVRIPLGPLRGIRAPSGAAG